MGDTGGSSLNAQNRSAILRYIQTQAVEGWLNGAMTGRRSRWRVLFCVR